jgi:tetratricopeptide (TPR) repeat protein
VVDFCASMIRVLGGSLLGLAVLSTTLLAESTPLAAVREALQQGRADDALRGLSQNNSAEAHNLRCRVYMQEQRWEKAVKECELAVHADPGSINHLWLGRAYGEKAERAGVFSAFSLGKQVRQEFEAATKTDPRNAEAYADLGEFYISAPGIVGGGREKAESVARKLEPLDRVRSLELSARIAESQKNFTKAESSLKMAIQASRKPADAWMTLASFYRRQQRWDDMVAAVRSGLRADPEHSSALIYGAGVISRTDREPKFVMNLMEFYLASSHKSEDAPAFDVYVNLANFKQKTGDHTGALECLNKALALAQDYQPALDAKKKLEASR